MQIIKFQLDLLVLVVLSTILQGNYVKCYVASSNRAIDPFGLLKRPDSVIILKRNCAELCKECNGVANLERGVCKCDILTDYPMRCLAKVQKKAQSLGIKLVSKSPLRTKRCLGSGSGFPMSMFGIGLNKAGNDQLTDMVGAPTEALNTLAGIVTAPLIEQLRAVFGGDDKMAHETIPGQIVENIPKALSSFSSLFDTFNVAAPTPNQFVGDGRDSGGNNGNSQLGDLATDLLSSVPMVNQLRAVFVADPYTGNVENTIPVQFARTLPVALNSMVELLSSFGNVGSMGVPASSSSQNSKPPADKSWMFEDDDDEDDDNHHNNAVGNSPTLGNPAEKIIVSPFSSHDREASMTENSSASPNEDVGSAVSSQSEPRCKFFCEGLPLQSN